MEEKRNETSNIPWSRLLSITGMVSRTACAPATAPTPMVITSVVTQVVNKQIVETTKEVQVTSAPEPTANLR
jgi:hypothetical protein